MKPGDLIQIKPIYKNGHGVHKGFSIIDLECGWRECGTFPKNGVGIFITQKYPNYQYVEVFVNGVFGSISEDFIEVVE